MSHHGRVYIVTGAGSGMGKCTAVKLAKQGAKLGLIDLKILPEVVNELKGYGGAVESVTCDITNVAQVDAAIAQLATALGPLDGAANLAGVMSKTASILETKDSDWDFIVNINLNGNKNCLRAELRHASPNGMSIVNTSSCSAQRGTANNSCYSAAKAGVLGLTRAVALEAGKTGSRVNCVVPGIVNTPLLSGWANNPVALDVMKKTNSMNRLGEPDEIAAVVCFLLGPDSTFVNGAEYNVDGGRY